MMKEQATRHLAVTQDGAIIGVISVEQHSPILLGCRLIDRISLYLRRARGRYDMGPTKAIVKENKLYEVVGGKLIKDGFADRQET